MLVIPIVFIFVLSVFCGWDWLTQGTALSTGTLTGVTYISQTPDMWGDVAKAGGILLLVIVAWLIIGVPILGILMRNGGSK